MNLDLDHIALNRRLEGEPPQEILRWAWETFAPRIAGSSSFQSQSVALLHMIAQIVPAMPVLFLDTGYHFPETLEFRDHLGQRLGLNIQLLEPTMGHDSFRQRFGALYLRNPDRCCYINKVEPLQRALKNYDAWISGIRRDQTGARATTPIISREQGGRYKICPLANWTGQQVRQYISEHGLPQHPLAEKGYPSIGCAPCTRPVRVGEAERDGRWAGQSKIECGLHLPPAQDGNLDGVPKDLDVSSAIEKDDNL